MNRAHLRKRLIFAKEAIDLGCDYPPLSAQLGNYGQTILGGYFWSLGLSGLPGTLLIPLFIHKTLKGSLDTTGKQTDESYL